MGQGADGVGVVPPRPAGGIKAAALCPISVCVVACRDGGKEAGCPHAFEGLLRFTPVVCPLSD